MTRNKEIAVVQSGNNKLAVRTELQEHFVTPFADVYELNDAFVVAIEMPGATKETISVSLEPETLIVKAKVQPYYRHNASLLYNELMQNKTYYRVFNLGSGVNRDTIEAQYEHGVLMLKLWKHEELRGREIPIK